MVPLYGKSALPDSAKAWRKGNTFFLFAKQYHYYLFVHKPKWRVKEPVKSINFAQLLPHKP